MPSRQTPPVRSGRRPGPSDTREAILRTAREAFAGNGFAATSLRGVARDAGVDPALVIHFFGSKAGLFTAAVGWPFEPEEEMRRVVADGPASIGINLARMFVGHWEDERERSPIVAVLHVATGDPAGAALMREYLVEHLLRPLIAALGTDDAEWRAGLIVSRLIGMGLTRYVLAYEPLASAPAETVVAVLAEEIQGIVDS